MWLVSWGFIKTKWHQILIALQCRRKECSELKCWDKPQYCMVFFWFWLIFIGGFVILEFDWLQSWPQRRKISTNLWKWLPSFLTRVSKIPNWRYYLLLSKKLDDIRNLVQSLDSVTLNLVTTCDLVTIFQRPFFNLPHKIIRFSDIMRFSDSFWGDQKCH